MTEDHGHGHETVEGPGYCPNCGTALEAASETAPVAASGRRPPACPNCDFVRWENPKLATGVVIEQDGAILLVRRNHDPMYGFWSFPSGFVDRGESVEEAARRETLEEAAVEIEIERLLGVYSSAGDPVVFIAWAGRISGGTPRPGPEALEVGFFPPDALPDLAFPHDPEIIEAWRRARGEREP